MAAIRSFTRQLPYQPLPFFVEGNHQRASKLDLNSLCIKHPSETFFIQLRHSHLLAWGMEENDLLIVEKTAQFMLNDLLVVEQNGEYQFYQFFHEGPNAKGQNEIVLFSLDSRIPVLYLQNWAEVKVAGVITNVVHQIRHSQSRAKLAA